MNLLPFNNVAVKYWGILKPSLQRVCSKLKNITGKYKRYVTIFKIIVSVSLIAYVITRADLSELPTIVSNIDFKFLILTFSTTFIASLFFNIRYLKVLRKFSISVPFWRLYLINRLSNLMNFVLPGGIGQEIGRLLYLDGGKKKVIISSLVDRLLGLASIVVILNISLFFVGTQFFYFIIAAGILIIIACLYAMKKLNLQLWDALAVSMIYTTLLIIMSYFQFRTLGIEFQIFELSYYCLLINLMLMIPISIQGIGLQEYMWYVLLGIPMESVLIYTLIGYLINFLLSLPGLIVVFQKRKAS